MRLLLYKNQDLFKLYLKKTLVLAATSDFFDQTVRKVALTIPELQTEELWIGTGEGQCLFFRSGDT